VLESFAYAVAEGAQPPFENQSVGVSMLRILAALDAYGGTDSQRGYVAVNTASALFVEGDRSGSLDCLERALALPSLPEELVAPIRLERIQELLWSQRIPETAEAMAAFGTPPGESALVLALLDPASATPFPEDDAERRSVDNAIRWFALQAELEMALGRLAAVDAPLVKCERLARRAGNADVLWYAIGLQLRLALARQLFEEVEPLVQEHVIATGLFDALSPNDHAQLELQRCVARHELSRRSDPNTSAAGEELLALSKRPGVERHTRSVIALTAAGVFAEAGRIDRAREQLEALRAESAQQSMAGHANVLERANFDAIAMRVAAASADPEVRRGALEQLERSTRQFLEYSESIARLSSGVATLHFASRERVLSELIHGCLAVDGPRDGAARALRWVYESQRIGGLARELGVSASDDGGRADIDALVGPERGLCVFQSGRVESFLFLVDASGVEALTVAPGWTLRRDASDIANVVTQAVQSGAGAHDARVRDVMSRLAPDVGAAALLERFARWKGATLVGDDSVGHLPVALLETADGRRVGDHLALGYAPSIPVGAALTRRARSRGVVSADRFRMRIVGVPPPPSEIDVPAARLEAWRDRLDGRALLAVGADATPAALEAADCSALQVLAHGKFDASRECRAGFALAGETPQSAVVWSDEVERRAAARLTLLGVCRASQRPVLRGDDGRNGLAASFLVAGSDCVVQTPIDLEVDDAVEFFESVSAFVAAGRSPADAVWEARRAIAGSGRVVPLQDYLVHAWGAAHEPIAAASRENTSSQTGAAGLARWWWAPLALAVAALVWFRRRRRVRRWTEDLR